MNRTARRNRTLSAATLALMAAGLTVGSLSASAIPFPPVLVFPAIPVFPTIPPILTIPPVVTLPPFVTIPPILTIPPVIFSMPVSVSEPAGPVERSANYAYSMTISMGSGITGRST